MSDELDLAELRRLWLSRERPGGTNARDTILALIDRIEALEAERDEAALKQRVAVQIGLQHKEDRDRAEAEATRLRHWEDKIVQSAVQHRERADRAEARLARVTDDAFEAEMERALEDADRWDSGYADASAALPVILATIRAAAANEQEDDE